jgi:cytochrome c biogenesis protein CcdA
VNLGFAAAIAGLGLVDSLNPATIAVGVLLATTERPLGRMAGYIAGIFSVYLAGGLILTLGPGSLLRKALDRPESTALDVAFLVAAAAAFAFGVWVFLHRDVEAKLPDVAVRPGSAVALGAGMTAVDLPTAFPYFAAILAILGEDLANSTEVALVVLFNLMYVVPLVVIAVAAALLGERAPSFLTRVRAFVTRWSPVLLALLSVAAGGVLLFKGVTGLAS